MAKFRNFFFRLLCFPVSSTPLMQGATGAQEYKQLLRGGGEEAVVGIVSWREDGCWLCVGWDSMGRL